MRCDNVPAPWSADDKADEENLEVRVCSRVWWCGVHTAGNKGRSWQGRESKDGC